MSWFWYLDPNKMSYVGTYKNQKEAEQDVAKVAAHGWMPTAITATDGHINLGRTVAGATLTGGISLLFGGSRTKGKVMITYTRSPQWLAEQAQKKEEDRIKREQEKMRKKEERVKQI